jgi:hypothetical protein
MFIAYSHPPADEREICDLRDLIERSVATGKLSLDQLQRIESSVVIDAKSSVEAFALCQELIWSRLVQGELEYDWV